MASINKLSLRGIRSFSPDDEEQVVEFSFPCTIIVGSNGCGKTTIIEALKYGVCGALPPGNRAGQAFVHDPRSAGQSNVKGNVKLRITNRAGAPMVVIRSMEVTQKKTTMTFKQLDGVLRTMDPNTGERVSLSHKCTELDKQIPTLLGVSKAILESVIFCHQEDSSWPLMEGAVLKKRFDDIFDSTRYSKALDNFKKLKKEMQMTVKDHKADLNGLASHKHAAKGFEKESRQLNEALETIENEIQMYTKEIRQSDQEIQESNEIFSQIEELKAQIDTAENNYHTQEIVADSKRETLGKEDLTQKHNTQELKDMLVDFDEQMKQKVSEKEELSKKTQAMKRQILALRQNQHELNKKMGKFTAEKEAQERKLKDRFNKMESIASTYAVDLATLSAASQGDNTTSSIVVNSDSQTVMGALTGNNNITNASSVEELNLSKQDMQNFFGTLEMKENELKQALKGHKDTVRAQEDQLQSTLTDLTGKLKAIENERAKLSNQQMESQREIQSLSSQFASGHARIRKTDIEDAKRQAAKFTKERDQLSQDQRRTQIPIEIRSIEEKMDKLKRKIEDDQAAITQLRDNAEAQNAVVVLQEQCVKDLEILNESFQEEAFNLQQKYNIQVPKDVTSADNDDADGNELHISVENLSYAIREKYDAANLKLTKAQDDVQKSQQVVSEKTAILSHKKQLMIQSKTKINELERGSVGKIRSLLDSQRQDESDTFGDIPMDIEKNNPQELLDIIDKRLEQIEDDSPEACGDSGTVRAIVKKLKKLSKQKDTEGNFLGLVCPCCRKDIDNPDEATVFQESMEELMTAGMSPLLKVDSTQLKSYRQIKSKYQDYRKAVSQQMNDLLTYQRLIQEVSKDIEPKVNELESTVSQKQLDLSDHKASLSDIQGEVDELSHLLELSRRWSQDTSRIVEKKLQISQKQVDYNSVSMCDMHADRDLKTVERELNERLEEKDNYANKINRLNKEMTQFNERMNRVSDQVSKLDKLARDKETKFNKEQQATERKRVLTSQISSIGEEERKLQEQLAPLRQKIRSKESEKQRLRSHSNDEEEKLSETLNSFLSELQHLKDVTKQIEDYAMSNKSDEYNSASAEAEKLVGDLREKEVALKSSQEEYENVTKAVDDQERHKQMLQENINLLELQRDMESTQKMMQKLTEDMQNIEGHDTCQQAYKKAQEKKLRAERAKSQFEGKRISMIEQIRSIKRKLSTPEYKDIENRHHEAAIKHETTQIAVEDLDKYANALDKALLRFHSLKIADINKIIKELWLLTYKGEDITNIELVSGQEAGSRATKSYNYRVVMTKGDTKLDMRGRCSAGQRVLASIVIRLALAETFGVNCGCIALDEPTVNLDYNNKRGLATALAQIIASRAQQKNFQLILITHDEDFVVMMKTELSTQSGFAMPEKYFQVRREEGSDGKFYSKIDAIDWDELL